MELSSNGIDWLLLSGRLCVAMLFAVSAASKLRQEPAEIKVLTNLHVSAPAAAEMITGVCAAIGIVALVLALYVRGASVLLAIFMRAVSFMVLSFWSGGDPPPVRAQKRNSLFANIAIAGGLLYIAAMGPGRFALGP